MRRQSSPASITHCIEELLDALCEAHDLARRGYLDRRFAETMRFATNLLEIINEGRDTLARGDPQALDELDTLRERVLELSALLPAARTLH